MLNCLPVLSFRAPRFPFRRSKVPSLESVLSRAAIRDFDGRPKYDIDVLFWLGGDPEREDLRQTTRRTLDRIREEFENWHVSLLVDGPEWADSSVEFACGREIRLEQSIGLPQALFGWALRTSKFPWCGFAWPGSNPNANALLELRDSAAGADLVYAESLVPIPDGVSHPVEHGRLQMFDAVPMECCLVRTNAARSVAFDCSPILQRLFWRKFVIHLSREGQLASRVCTSARKSDCPWSEFPFSNAVDIDPHIAARYVHAGNDFQAFTADLPHSEAKEVEAACKRWASGATLQTPKIGDARGKAPLRVLVLGGIYEPPNNELVFFRIFSKLRGRGHLTWRTKLYADCRAEDLQNHDLVIFSRPRYAGCDQLMQQCKRLQIGTIVMIDDNWIALGRESERYARIFGPGQPQMETFLSCVRQADVTLVYSDLLAADLAPYAREIFKFLPFIDLELYATRRRERANGCVAGFSGSERPETPAFRALADLAKRHQDVRLIFFGPPLPQELKEIDAGRVHWVPYQFNYEKYIQSIVPLQPDILLAPLTSCRGWASKVPNKILEIPALGAAGIYSRVEPYISYVRDGETGLLVENSWEGWNDALEQLYLDAELRGKIVARSQEEIRARYSMEHAIPRLLTLFERVAK